MTGRSAPLDHRFGISGYDGGCEPEPDFIRPRTALNDMIEPTDRHDPIERSDPHDATEPTDRNDPTEPMDSTEPLEPIDSTESSDHSDHLEVLPTIGTAAMLGRDHVGDQESPLRWLTDRRVSRRFRGAFGRLGRGLRTSPNVPSGVRAGPSLDRRTERHEGLPARSAL